MMKKSRITALLLAVALLLTVFAACGKDENESGSKIKKYEKASTQSVDEHEDNFEEKPFGDENTTAKETLKVATASFPPYIYFDEFGETIGIEAEIVTMVAEKLGMECEFINTDFNGIIADVRDGKFDIAVTGLVVTEDRLQDVDFSDAYITNTLSVIVKKGSGIETISDLADKQIGVVTASVADFYATDDYGEGCVNRFVDADSAVMAVASGSVDAFIVENETAMRITNDSEFSEHIEILGTDYAVDEYAIAVSKDNPELLTQINRALAELEAEGRIDEIIAKYIY